MSDPRSIILELTRVDEPDDPHAFRFEPQGYTLRGPDGGVVRFEVPWGSELLADIASLRRPGRDPAVLQRLGDVLQRALRPIGWRALGEEIRGASAAGRMVVVTLRSNAAELYALPWELLTVGASGEHLGELSSVILRYAWPDTATVAERPSPPPEGGRILLAWSAAGGAVPAAEHQRAIASTWSDGHVDFDPAVDVLPHASAGRIAAALERAAEAGEPYAILHLLAHGGRTGSTYGVVLDGEEGGASVVDGARLRHLLVPHAGALRLVVVAACESGNTGDPANHLGSVAQALHRAGIRSVIASRYPLTLAGSLTLTEELYRALLVELESLERAFMAARDRLARDPESLDWASLQLYARVADGDDTRPLIVRPFRGLLSFQSEHARLFFGRAAESEELCGELAALVASSRPRLMIVAGGSGVGKSSVVFAGAVPRWIRGPERPEILRMRPGRSPPQTLEALLAGRRAPTRPAILIVDQFEEIFTHVEVPEARERFVRLLWDLAGDRERDIRIVVTLRIDFIGHCGDVLLDDEGLRLDRIAYHDEHQVFVAQMTRENLREAIERPAAAVGVSFEPGLVERMLEDVDGEPGSLPILQDTLDLLWQRRVGSRLTQAAYDALGGVTGALHGRADRLIDSLDPGDQRVARRLLCRLVSIGPGATRDTRRRAEVAALRPSDAVEAARFDAVVDTMVDARLLVRDEDAASATVEIAHEALIRRWPRLSRWLSEDRDKLAEIAKLEAWVKPWQQHGTLLTGAQLGYAIEVAERYPEDIDASIAEMLTASRAAEARWRALLRRATVGAAAAALLFAGLAAVSLWLWRDANEQRSRADAKTIEASEKAKESQARAEEARAMALEARNSARLSVAGLAREDLALTLGFLRELEDDAAPARIDLWNTTVIAALGDPLRIARVANDVTISAAALGAGGRLLTGDVSGKVKSWSIDELREPPLVVDAESRVLMVASSPDERWIIAGSEDGAHVWDLAAGEPAHHHLLPGEPVPAVAVSPDSGTFAVATSVGVVRFWGATRALPARGELDAGAPVTEILFAADGERMATVSVGARATLYALRTDAGGVIDGALACAATLGEKALQREWLKRESPDADADTGASGVWTPRRGGIDVACEHAPLVHLSTGVMMPSADGERLCRKIRRPCPLEAAFGDGERMVTVVDDEASLWRLTTPRFVALELGGGVDALAYSPGGELLAAGGERSVVRVWEVGRPDQEPRELVAPAAVRALAFAPDGALLVAGTERGARVWEVARGFAPLPDLDPDLAHRSLGFAADGRLVTCVAPAPDRPATEAWIHTLLGTPAPRVQLGDGSASSAACSADGRLITRDEAGEGARMWEVDREPRNIGDIGRGALLALASDRERLLVTTDEPRATLFDGAVADAPGIELPVPHAIPAARFNPAGDRLVTVGLESVEVWARDASLRATFPSRGGITSAVFSPDGATIAIGADDGGIQLWPAWSASELVPEFWRVAWRATLDCPSVESRQRMMHQSPEQAAAGWRRCEAMIECIAGASDARLDACRRELRRAQLAGADFEVERVTAGDGDDERLAVEAIRPRAAALVGSAGPAEPRGQEAASPRCPPGMALIEGTPPEGYVDREGARHRVKDLCLDITEVTVDAFGRPASQDAMRERGCNARYHDRGRHPMNCVTWREAQEHCGSRGARLPTEWEWEWAARGREEARTYPWGEDTPTCSRVVMQDGGNGCGEDRTWPVASKGAGTSRDGLKDMSGNVWEWTASASGPNWAVRGGCLDGTDIKDFTTVARYAMPADLRHIGLGFRCARTAK